MTHQTRTYSLLVRPEEEGGYPAYSPALTGCHTSAETYEDAVKNAEEVLLGCLDALRKNGEKIPFEEYLSNEMSLGVMVKLPAAS